MGILGETYGEIHEQQQRDAREFIASRHRRNESTWPTLAEWGCIGLIVAGAILIGILVLGCTPDPLAIHDVVEVGGEG